MIGTEENDLLRRSVSGDGRCPRITAGMDITSLLRLRADAQEKSRYSREESVFTGGIDSKVKS
jgi:hypothetical protein